MQKIPYKTDQNNPAIRAYSDAVEKGKKNQHIIPYKNRWAITNLDSGKATHIFTDSKEAVNYAEKHASAGTAIFIHDSDGRIQERRDF